MYQSLTDRLRAFALYAGADSTYKASNVICSVTLLGLAMCASRSRPRNPTHETDNPKEEQ